MLSAQAPAQNPHSIQILIVLLVIAIVVWWRAALMILAILLIVMLGYGALAILHDVHNVGW